ncbi:divalent-cation tolerance protein CutA [Sphingomonas gilva]|uniref:Divalent-cation tolerance protein CutA n=1 Tax=Sphingomonas gilva TaxID=2305907 RepID=A0A396RPW9_9SPHN|nr:divalent-cation tolerance protein CutA [Sphingomonas gilva]RHW18498.1 divalent-cation tolerance protein CutA [Sphingomonas gilva]
MTDLALVYAVFADAAEAERIAALTVEERLAACANILGPIRSIYRWRGEIERADEIAVLFKTDAAHVAALRDRIAGLHSYDLPAIVDWPASASAAYAGWVADGLLDMPDHDRVS